jgi:phage terminase Nu1 subunit (DNA packaging protein)
VAEQPTVAVNELAEIFLLTPRRVQQLADEGIINRNEHGRYPIWPCVQGYIKYLQQNRTANQLNGNEEKIRLLRTQADLNELKLAEQADMFVLADDAEFAIENIITAARSELMSSARHLQKKIKRDYEIDIELDYLQDAYVYPTLTRLAEHAADDDDAGEASLAEMATA